MEIIEAEFLELAKGLVARLDKSQILTEALQKVFGLSPDEIAQLSTQIEFIIDNKLITKKGIVQKSVSTFANFVLPTSVIKAIKPTTSCSIEALTTPSSTSS